jgi:hypothetical protein
MTIRETALQLFQRNLKIAQKQGGTPFRRKVMDALIAQFDITLASAATHYNYALNVVRNQDPTVVEGIGRAPGKNNGGRPRGVSTDLAAASTAQQPRAKPVKSNIKVIAAVRRMPLSEGINANRGGNTDHRGPGNTTGTGLRSDGQVDQRTVRPSAEVTAPAAEPEPAAEMATAPTPDLSAASTATIPHAQNTVTVVREKSGMVVEEGVSRRKAMQMVAESGGGRGRVRLAILEDQA